MTSKVEKVGQKPTFTHKLTTNLKFQTPLLFFSFTFTELKEQDCGISKTEKDISMLLSKIDQLKASQKTGSKAIIGFGQALVHFYLEMYPPKSVF